MRKNTLKPLKQRLLVSIRGKKEAIAAYKGGAHIIDVEYPASALGTPYPLNILAVKSGLPKKIPVATNIGEEQTNRGTACQAALGVALAGADIIKLGFAKYSFREAAYLGGNIVRTIKKWYPSKKVIPAVFADKKLSKVFDPIDEGPKLAKAIKADGILIDTFDKEKGLGLLDLLSLKELSKFVKTCRKYRVEAWIAGSITAGQLPDLWRTSVNVICIRGAACGSTGSKGRFAEVTSKQVKELICTM